MTSLTYDSVYEFQTKFKRQISPVPSVEVKDAKLRWRLISEEMSELFLAALRSDYIEMADALGDLDYVIEGAAITFGFKLNYDIGYSLDNWVFDGDIIGAMYTSFEYFSNALNYGSWEEARLFLSELRGFVYLLAERWEVPLEEIVAAIHKSNMTKLDEDGEPILDSHDKIMKGPNYIPPTEDIKKIMESVTFERRRA